MLSFAGASFFAMAQETQGGATPAPDPNAPEFKWESTTLDYGTVTKGDESNAKREFKFTNVGKSQLIISSCRGSCGCTVPTCPTEAILPGKSGTIQVHYDINRVGPFTKTVTVSSNAKNPNETLKIQGTVTDPSAGQPANNGTQSTTPPAQVAPKSTTSPH